MKAEVISLKEKRRAVLSAHLSEFLENLQAVNTYSEMEYMVHQWRTKTRDLVLASKGSWLRTFVVKQVVKLIDWHFAHRPTAETL